jgi:D-alanyl-D-alanine carboxypeptidase/D-alanyl-D-alanine-endopeptidase (penicillin-binding protein 4)
MLAAVVVLVLAAGAFVGLDATGHVPGALFDDPRSEPTATASPSPSPPVAGPVLTPATGTAGSAPAVAAKLLTDPALGGDVGAYVVDVATGAVLLDRDAAGARAPASVAKLATAAAALVALGPAARLETRTVTGAQPGEVVLVGGGDTTLTTRAAKAGYPRPATLAELADATATALRVRAVVDVTVRVDDSLFTGPTVSPDWQPGYVGAGVVSPVSALSLDGGRVRPGLAKRSRDPAVTAGEQLARLLRDRGISVRGQVARATAPPDAETLGTVSSPEVSSLVETMLDKSDNDLAESLIRLVAASRDQPATFEGGTAAVAEVLTELAVPTDGLALLDGSGLSRGSRVAPETLGALLALAAGDGADPRLRPLVTGLPVAAISGPHADRFGPGAGRGGAGVVRAKTGTLTGVASLAGVVVRGDGSPPGQSRPLLAFALMTDDVPAAKALAARIALDRIAAALAAPDG